MTAWTATNCKAHTAARRQLHVVATHQYMTGEQPRTMLLHYWGHGPATDLARCVKAALGDTSTGAEQGK